MLICKEIDDYINQVRHGDLRVCKEQKQLVDYVERCFSTEDLHVDKEQLSKYMALQKYFPFQLFPWEKFLFALQNCVYKKDGRLRWQDLFILVGRGAGKNGFVAFESFCWITPVNGIKAYNVDIFANSEEQAQTSFNDIHGILEDGDTTTFKKAFNWNKEEITNLKTRSKIKFRTSGIKTKDGGRPGAIIFDEYHQYEDTKLLTVAITGLGKKRMPRTTIITTDGDVRGGPLDDMKARADGILSKGMPDNGLLPFICKLDNEKEVDDEQNWYKANPSLQYFPDLLNEIRKEYADYKINPIGNHAFVVKRMNLPRTYDAKSVTDWENIAACSIPFPKLDGCECVAGIDYAKTTDFVSAGLLFKYNDIYFWKQHTWVCKESKDLPLINAPLDDWESLGYITYVDEPEISPDIPAKWLEEQGQKYNITCLGIDNFRITLLKKALSEHGFDFDKAGANNIRLTKRVTMNRYVPVITSLFNTHRIGWGDDPMMRWYTWNASIEEQAGNQYYGKKEPKSRKTDGFFALVSAICASEDLQDSNQTADDMPFYFMGF